MTLEELKKLIADDEGETVEVKETTGKRGDACETLCAFLNYDPPICDSNPRNLRIAHCSISVNYSGLQTLGFAFAKGKQRLVVSGRRGKKDEEIRKQ